MKRKPALPIIALLALLVRPPGILASGGPDQGFAARMDAYLQAAHKLNRFSGTVLVARGGQIVLRRGYGLADYENDVPNAPETKFRLGSVTKQFASMAILQLEEKGKLKVTDTVRSVFPDYPGGDRITIHNLLTHTSGIPNLTDFPDYLKTMALPSPALQTVERFKNLPLDFAPGEKFSYSNSGYILLGAIIEKVTGGSYEDYLRKNVFGPLGMDNSGYDHPEIILKHRARGYEFSEDRQVNAAYIDMTTPHAAGALYSTVDDLYKWDRALYTEKLVSKASLAKLFTPFKDNYAYGWMITSLAGHRNIRHSGGINGFTSDVSRFPDDDACVIVLNNFSTGFTQEISDALANLLFGQNVEMPVEKKAVQLPASVLAALQGQYKLEGTTVVFSITAEAGGLFVQIPQQPKVVLLAESETKFFMKTVGFEVTFVKDAAGKVTHFILKQGKRETKAVRLD
jgi:CubicO group peptidase (beta-lactamase class C family)